MKAVLVLSCLFIQIVLTLASPRREVRIIGGENAADAEFPFQVSIQLMGGMGAKTDLCGGVIYNESIIVSSALCVQGALDMGGGNNYLRALAGTSDISSFTGNEQAIYVAEIFPHPQFDKLTGDFDIAYLKLREPFILNDRVKPIQLAQPDFEPTGQILTLGWGNHDPDWTLPENSPATAHVGQETRFNWTSILQKMTVEVISSDDCGASLSEVESGRILTENMFCGSVRSEQGICARDGGGPALCQSDTMELFLCGITSWSVPGCTQSLYPIVYTNVGKFRSWLDTELAH